MNTLIALDAVAPHETGEDATSDDDGALLTRSPATPLAARVSHLLAAPYRYNLFQAISLLERAATREDDRRVALGTGDGRNEGVRFSAYIALRFPCADIHTVRAGTARYATRPTSTPDPAYLLSTPVMSLAGVQGPLPVAFTELILQRNAARDHATGAFLDIFHHRFLSFLYRSRKKHTASLHTAPLRDAPLVRSAAALANLGDPAAPGDAGPRPWLQHAGLLGAAPRSIIGLLTLLHDRLGTAFTARQFVGAWVPLDRASPLTLGDRTPSHDAGNAATSGSEYGTTIRLDGQCGLGQRFWDQSAGIELACVLHDRARYDAFLPGGETHALMVWLVRRYLQSPMDVHLVLRLMLKAAQPVRLTATEPMRLGWSSWLAHRTELTGALPAARLTLSDRSIA
ncbi:type VI secretion system baseplate subunit TssG [Robbsia andropogonis]|uniref:type VI secretion system baseplate subunit TssG n=1 Tax=Robbsia andropogonis TaxID=28092 RepID=UPI002A698D5A|nr:type VI secretion system baseplate subunit TssG [Robbsia andropogonis]